VDFLIKFLASVLVWLLGFVSWTVIQVTKLCLEGLLAVFNAIPLCPCFQTASATLSEIPGGVAFFAHSFLIGPGLQTLLCCWLLRFLIRRIPFIG
jgi:hypothetical protein